MVTAAIKNCSEGGGGWRRRGSGCLAGRARLRCEASQEALGSLFGVLVRRRRNYLDMDGWANAAVARAYACGLAVRG